MFGLSANKSSSSSTTVNTADNRRTIAGEGINTEGTGNTTYVERADAGVLNSAASLLSDVSLDNAETVRAGLALAKDLGVNTQTTAATLTDGFLKASNQAVSNLQAGQEKTLRTLTDAYNNAKTADAEQVNKLAEKSLLAVGALAGLGLLALLVSKKK